MSLASKCAALQTSAVGVDTLITEIFTDALLPASEADYVNKYFAEKPRRKIWTGSFIEGGMVRLSTAAATLKSALQRRYASTGQFPPITAYHGTKDHGTADLIVENGFRAAGETLFGNGCYFFATKDRAEAYARTGVGGRVIEVTIFGGIAVANPPALGGDIVVLQTSGVRTILLVKNALVIFPKAVYTP